MLKISTIHVRPLVKKTLINFYASFSAEPAQKRRKSSGPLRGSQMEEVKLYGSELVVYDKHKRCLLTDGDYELVLQEVQPSSKNSPKKHSSWEAIGEIQEVKLSYTSCLEINYNEPYKNVLLTCATYILN